MQHYKHIAAVYKKPRISKRSHVNLDPYYSVYNETFKQREEQLRKKKQTHYQVVRSNENSDVRYCAKVKDHQSLTSEKHSNYSLSQRYFRSELKVK